MLVRFAYSKLIRPNQSTFTPGTAVSTYLQSPNIYVGPLGDAGLAAPSTVIIDQAQGGNTKANTYILAKAWSTVHAQLSAATSADAPVNLF